MVFFFCIINPLLTKLHGLDGWILASLFLCMFMDLDSVSAINPQKKNLTNMYQAILTSRLVTNQYISKMICSNADMTYNSCKKNTTISLHTGMQTFCDSCGINKVSCAQTANHMRVQITDFDDNL